jgi:hypothetical protein
MIPMEPLTPESVCVRSDDVVSREIEGELILVPVGSGIGDLEDELYTMNPTGRAVWNLMDGKRSLREIAAELGRQYSGSPDVIARDVIGIAGELAKRKIVLCRS